MRRLNPYDVLFLHVCKIVCLSGLSTCLLQGQCWWYYLHIHWFCWSCNLGFSDVNFDGCYIFSEHSCKNNKNQITDCFSTCISVIYPPPFRIKWQKKSKILPNVFELFCIENVRIWHKKVAADLLYFVIAICMHTLPFRVSGMYATDRAIKPSYNKGLVQRTYSQFMPTCCSSLVSVFALSLSLDISYIIRSDIVHSFLGNDTQVYITARALKEGVDKTLIDTCSFCACN